MAKPIKNRIVTGSACLNYVDNAIGFISTSSSGFGGGSNDVRIGIDAYMNFFIAHGEMAGQLVSPSGNFESNIEYRRYLEFVKFHHNNRVIGLILDDNDDGSYKIALLGSETMRRGSYQGENDNLQGSVVEWNVISSYEDAVEISPNKYKYNFAGTITYGGASPDHNSGITRAMVSVYNYKNTRDLTIDEALNFKLPFYYNSGNTPFLFMYSTGEYRGANIRDMGYNAPVTFELTTSKNNTLIVGKAISEIVPNLQLNEHCIMYDTYNTIFDAYEGDFYTMLENIYSTIVMQSIIKPDYVVEGKLRSLFTRADFNARPKLAGSDRTTHAFLFTPFNLILTRNESQALAYLENGTLPSDAFLYPLDWQNLPRTDGTPSTQDEDPSGTPPSGEDGDSGIDGTPTRDADPQITSNMLTNNNLYWLQAGQLESFITWFWQNAGEIIELDDLWDRIKGLYNDLASAIINIRYFPVDPYYIGGVSDTTNIVLSSIEMPITGIKKLNKTKLRKRTLGEISIPNKYNAFTDYSPYTSLMLYLPFHGWIDLDIDIFTGNKLQVRCIYDHISGTIQYGVYVISKGKEFLLNTVIAKMAVDIPITLQSKNDRDSAIFNNVTNAFGNLLGAGASAVSGNPIGLVMSTAGVASSGTQSAPLKVNGTVGETGAFFMPNKCAVYIKRPSYNRPKNYGARVGYPSNQGGKLSEFTGYTTVYNPQITFSGNTNADNVTIKPLQSEIDEIYTALEKGVIL